MLYLLRIECRWEASGAQGWHLELISWPLAQVGRGEGLFGGVRKPENPHVSHVSDAKGLSFPPKMGLRAASSRWGPS